MTTIVAFQPSQTAPFQFQAEFDGATYQVLVTWSLFGQRYYVGVFDLSGNLIFLKGLVGSPVGVALQSISWDAGIVTAVTASPHGFKLGVTVELTVSNAVPDDYNGTFECVVTGPNSFTYALANEPAMTVTAFGEFDYDVNLLEGYFETSTMIFQDANEQFLIGP